MSYPVPIDPRVADDFQVIRNYNAIDFEDHIIYNEGTTTHPTSVGLGEPLVYTGAAATVPTAYKLNTAAGNIVGYANDYKFAGWSWNKFTDTFEGYGSPSCLVQGAVPVAKCAGHRVRVKRTTYLYRPAPAAGLRIKDTAQTPAPGDDVVAVDCGAGVVAKFACLLPKTADVTGAASTGRYKAAVLATPTSAEEALNARIDNAIVGKVVLVDTNYIEIEFN